MSDIDRELERGADEPLMPDAAAAALADLVLADADLRGHPIAADLPAAIEAARRAIVEAVRDLLWKATPFGTTVDGDTFAYIVPKGAVHRLVGVMQGAGYSASLRSMAPFIGSDGTGPDWGRE